MFKIESKIKNERKAKINICKSCGEEIPYAQKFCSNCCAKTIKPIYKKKLFWIPIIFFLFIGIVVSSSSSDTDNNVDTKDTTQEEVVDENKIPEPDGIELKTDFEKSVWEVVYNHNTELWSIETFTP